MDTKEKEKSVEVERLLQKVDLIASNCTTLTWDLRFHNIRGDEVLRLKDNLAKDGDKEEKLRLLKKSIVDSVRMCDDAYSVVGVVGPYTPKANRTQIKEVINPYLLPNKEEDEEDTFIPAPPTVSGLGQQKQHQPVSSVMATNYSDKETWEMMCGLFPAGQDGLGNPEAMQKDPRTHFFLQMQEYKIKSDVERERLSGIVDSNNKEMAQMKAKLDLLEKENNKLRNDNERQKKYIERMRPKVEEADRLSTKNGQIAQIASGVLSGLALNVLAGTKYGSLLGIGQESEAQQQQQPAQQEAPSQSIQEDNEDYNVEPSFSED